MQATREKVQADENTKRARRSLQEIKDRLHSLERDIFEMEQRMLQDTQVCVSPNINHGMQSLPHMVQHCFA